MKKIKIVSLLFISLMILWNMGAVFAEESTLLIAPNPFANDSIKVLLNDQIIDFTDENGNVVEPQIINSRTMVPMRKIFEVFGAEVEWNGELREVTARSEEKVLKLTIDNTEATVQEGENTETIILDAAPTIVEGRTLVPVRFIAESLNLKVGWDSETRTVIILDTSFIMEKLEKDTPIFCELLNSSFQDSENIETEEATFSATGNIKYNNTKDKANNTNLKITIDGKLKENEEAMSADITIKTTGKGSLLEQVKEAKLEKATINFIFDKKEMISYIKSTLLESSDVGNKWTVIDMGLETLNLEMLDVSQVTNLEDIMNEMIDADLLTTNTYYQIEEALDLLCQLLGNDHLKVTGRTTKTYTYEITLDELLDMIGIEKSDLFANSEMELSHFEASLKITVKVEDGVATSCIVTIDGKTTAGNETTTFDLKTDTKITSRGKKVSINLPAEKDIVR